MHIYPLRFKVNGMDEDAPVTIEDKKKTPVLSRPHLSKEMRSGKAPVPVLFGSDKATPAFHIRMDTQNELALYTLSQPDGKLLATLRELKGHKWSLVDPQDSEVALFKEKMAMKRSCLFTLITSQEMEEWLKLLFSHGFKVYKNGKQVLWLREIKDTISWDYVCRINGELDEKEENLILAALTCMPFTVS